MLKLEAVHAFIVVAEAGSISEAARRLGLSKSLISDRLTDLEQRLGARLIHRTSRNLALTEDGLLFLERARGLIRDSEAAVTEIAARRGELVGTLRIGGPVSFSVLHLAPALAGFLEAHPGIDINLDVEDRLVDLGAGGHDAVVRHGPVQDGWITAVRLATSRRVLVASQTYLAAHGEPKSLAELEGHHGVLYTNRSIDWRFEGPNGPTIVHPRPRLRVNNGLVMRDAAAAGVGIALLPTFMMQGAPAGLRVLDVGAEAEGAEINLAFLKHQGASVRLRALIDHLQASFGDPPYWDQSPAQA
jgi:DNA-binding transcriptional LysR family regulator